MHADQADLEDVCREALLAIFKSRHTYQLSRPFEQWLYAIVRNVIAAYLQRHRQHRNWQESMSEIPEVSA